MRCIVSERSEALLEPLGKFVLEILPWTLSSLIVLYLIWGMWLAPQHAPAAGSKPPAEHAVAASTSVRAPTALAARAPAARAM
jgi:hypothetical protein